jgi:hypothetical protein
MEQTATNAIPVGVKSLKNMTVSATYPIGKPSPIRINSAPMGRLPGQVRECPADERTEGEQARRDVQADVAE